MTFRSIPHAFRLAALALAWTGCDRPPPSPPDPRIARGRELFERSCAACHEPHGGGKSDVAPPLDGSRWVTGSPERLVRIALHGVRGPIDVKGRTYNLEMEFPPDFSDEELADVLTYVRQAWSNGAGPIDAASIARIRQQEGRRDSWTAEQLLAVP